MSTKEAKPRTALKRRVVKKKTETASTKTGSARLTEEDKALDTVHYIKNPLTGKHVKKTSATGVQIVEGKEITKTPTLNETLKAVVGALQTTAPEILTNAVIKTTISQVDGIPRTFPSEWGGKGKKPKPDGKPKGPKNAYIIFATEMRPQVKNDNPGVPNSAKKGENSITAIIGQLWEVLSTEDRAEYVNKAAVDTERYESQMTVWEAEFPEHARKSTGPKKQTKTNGYRVYCEENREQFKTDNSAENGRKINSLLAEAWKALTDEEKTPFEKIAKDRNTELFGEEPDEDDTEATGSTLTPAEQAKADDPETFILNTGTKRYVKRSSKAGKAAIKALGGDTVTDTPATTEQIVDDDADLLN